MKEIKYIPYSASDENLKDLIKNGNVYGAAGGIEKLLSDEPETEIRQAQEDFNYFKSIYPAQLRVLSAMVEKACDKLEYEGSPMLAEYPDKEYIIDMAKKIYDTLDEKYRDEETMETMEAAAYVGADYGNRNRNDGYPGAGPQPGHGPKKNICPNCTMRNVLELLICNEFFCRRNRYRKHHKRFMY